MLNMPRMMFSKIQIKKLQQENIRKDDAFFFLGRMHAFQFFVLQIIDKCMIVRKFVSFKKLTIIK